MALPQIVLTNATVSDIVLTQLAITVPGSGTFTVSDVDRTGEILNDEELQVELDAGNITVSISGGDIPGGARTSEQSKSAIQPLNPLDIKHKIGAAVDPTTAEDDTAGYSVGSVWINTTANSAWRCVDASTGAAVWLSTTAANTWAQVLAAGRFSGANNPRIDDGQEINSDDTAGVKGGSYTIRAGDASAAFGGNLIIRSGDSGANVGALPLLTVAAGDWNLAAVAAPSTTMLLHGADSSTIGGVLQTGGVTLRGGDASSGRCTLCGGRQADDLRWKWHRCLRGSRR
jgi:hypothetical protein